MSEKATQQARRLTMVVGVLLTVVASLILPATVSAHTGFESSSPENGATVDVPVDVVTITFTGEATPVGDEFVALNANGVVQQPVNVEVVDDRVFTIRFDPPLAGGQIGVRWSVQAADAHPIEGAFSFTVDVSLSTTTAVPTTTPPTTIDSAATDVPATAVTNAEGDVAAEAEPATTAAPVTSLAEPAVVAAADDQVAPPTDGQVAEAGAPPTLAEFLVVDNSKPGETTATIGRVISFLGLAIGLGGLAFVATTLRGQRSEIRRALTVVRVLALAVAIGAAIEYIGVGRIANEAIGSTWSTAPGFATLLRLLGGIALAVGIAATIQRAAPEPATRSLSAAVIDDVSTGVEPNAEPSGDVRWVPTSQSWLAFGGVALLLGSFWFDGHTVSKGFRPLHALVNTVHVAAGSVWAGGVVALAVVAWVRHRSGRRTKALELVVRFSSIATVALAAVVVAGAVMAFLVLDSFGELTGTPWGQILLLKTAAVGLATIGGAYNHFRLLPALEADPDSPDLLAVLRSTVTAEAILLVFVVTVTAWLVSAAS